MPVHVTALLVKCGVTVIVAITGEVPALVAVKNGISPAPLAPRPILVRSLVHVYVVVPPVLVVVKITFDVEDPLHTT